MKKMKRIDTAADAVAMGTEAPERQEEARGFARRWRRRRKPGCPARLPIR